MKPLKIGRITASDRASTGVYEDASGPEAERCINAIFPGHSITWHRHLLPDSQPQLEQILIHLVDNAHCALIITTGGTGPSARDLTPEATRAILHKELPGFGEIMRSRSFDQVPTSILSRATAGIRNGSLILNLPGKPSAVTECLSYLGEAIRRAVLSLEKEREY